MSHDIQDILAHLRRGIEMLEAHVKPARLTEGQTFPIPQFAEYPKEVTRPDLQTTVVSGPEQEQEFIAASGPPPEPEPEPVAA